MSQAITKHRWQLLGLVIIVAAITAAAWYSKQGVQPVQAQAGGGEPVVHQLEEADYTMVQRLRDELALTDHDLAAMACTTEQVESVMDALVTWQQTNKAQIQAFRTTELQARAALRDALYATHNVRGNKTPYQQQIAAQQVALVENASNRRTFMTAAAESLTANFSSEQQTTHGAALANQRLPRALRYIPNLDTSNLDLSKRTDAELLSQLNFVQRTAADEALAKVVANVSRVNDAAEAVMPMPES
ncbi:MAG: hypothetical protein MI741_02990, partial [Rhodospirillales bacterium]|nr:hypothetical protein [Rhodospirillales bacterium]